MTVFIGVFDEGGRLVKTLCDGDREPGKHLLEWNGSMDRGGRAPSGTYYLQVEIKGVGIVARYRIVLE
ncbi:MAG TPA: FlgD immunoglobulin-like domain containing protein [Candidatus Kapabacteria bacterium]|nr:FlgD immunoglobulin-like domain containing protein [Candidatus Kapabacteria bacterium]